MANGGLPPGATLVSGEVPSQPTDASTTAGLPPGATLVSGTVPQATPAVPPSDTRNPADIFGKVQDFGTGIFKGAAESMGETIQNLPWVGKKILSPEAMQAEREYFKPGSAADKFGQTTGDIAEPILEFVLGDEALKGLALADKIGLASKLADFATKNPYVGKILQHGINAARMGTVGTAEALGKGATLPHALETGAATGVGGELLSAAADAAPAAVKAVRGFTNPFRKAASADPGFIQQVLQGEQVAQVPAQAATRAAVKAGGAEVGLSTVQPAGLRTLAEEPISIVNGLKKNVYGQVDKAAGTDIKTLYDKLDAINDKIDLEASGSPAEAKLEEARTSQMQTIEDAKAQARTKGVDVDKMLAKGDALHTREMALRDLQKGFLKNVNIVPGNAAAGTPETINVDSAVRAVQKLQDNTKFGAPRLEQALGKDGAKKFLDGLYAAQRGGAKAIKAQELMSNLKTIAEWTGGLSGAGLATYEILK
jgi:ElaB/YqjD/DUF883 family membrane-anchored ribosome-binding protein